MSVAVQKSSTRFSEKSPLLGVSVAAWQKFCAALEVQDVGAVSKHGGLGAYDIRPRRLVEIHRATNFRRVEMQDDTGAYSRQECDFILPWTQKRFLADPLAQRAVLVKSMRIYYDALRAGAIVKPDDVSMSGALVILHIGGLGALRDWPDLFDNTKARYEAAKGAF